MSDINTLLFYISAFSTSGLLMYYGIKRNYKIFIYTSLLIPILIGGLRYNVGTDYMTYVSIYNAISDVTIFGHLAQNIHGIELGFFVLMKISYLLMSGPELMFALANALIIIFFYIGLKRYHLNHTALIYTLYLFTIYPFTLNAIRQGIAMSICFFAFSYLIERKPKPFAFWIIIASIFHLSALAMLPFYLINLIIKPLKKHTSKLIIINLILLTMLTIIIIPIALNYALDLSIFEKYANYQNVSAEGNNYTFYLKLSILSVILILHKHILKISPYYVYFIAFAVIGLVMSLLGFSSDIFNRISLYLSFYNIILLSSIIDLFKDNLGKYLTYTILVLYLLLFFYISYFLLKQSDVIPYNVIWDKA